MLLFVCLAVVIVFITVNGVEGASDSEEVKIGIIDGGFDSSHPDLANMEVKTYEPDRFERNVTEFFRDLPRSIRREVCGYNHGNGVAGYIGETADRNKGEGLTGYCDRGYNDFNSIDDFIDALRDARDDGMEIINVSMVWSKDEYTADAREYKQNQLRKFIENEMQDVLIVAGAGNSNDPATGEPLAGLAMELDSVIAVGAVDKDGEMWELSNYGEAVTIAAPGVDIHSPDRNKDLFPGSSYSNKTGTSMSSAYVSGVAAKILEANPDLSPGEIKEIIIETADSHQYDNNKSLGAGVINLDRAVDKANSEVKDRQIIPEITDTAFAKITDNIKRINDQTVRAISQMEQQIDETLQSQQRRLEEMSESEPEPDPETCLLDDCDRSTFLDSDYCMRHRRDFEKPSQEAERDTDRDTSQPQPDVEQELPKDTGQDTDSVTEQDSQSGSNGDIVFGPCPGCGAASFAPCRSNCNR